MKQPDNTALLLVDLQNDFMSGGSLAVPEGEQVVSIANELMPRFTHVIATQDWHPKNHTSFIALWPEHCVQNTTGAELHPDLMRSLITKIIQKGTDPEIDSYSAFYDNNHLNSTGLTDYLRTNHITQLYVMGLATEYCVKFTCLDAISDGFSVTLIIDACRGIDLHKHDIENALHEMQDKGVIFVNSTAV